MPRTLGLLLAAGSGSRMGKPKALVAGADRVPWVVSASRVLRDGGCDPVVVVVGAEASAVRSLLDAEPVRVVEAPDWAEGMGASLRAGLRAIAGDEADAVLIHLVDLPDVGADVVRRMLALATLDVLARADYGHGPGHPVLIGWEHWSGVADTASADRGGRGYLAVHDVTSVDCRDLAEGVDVDEPGPMLGR
jgi:CTP:molybdopterin cytidylyltransferase MocA